MAARKPSAWQQIASRLSRSRIGALPPDARMAEPRAIELKYIRDLLATWRTAQAIIAYGMRPLIAGWPIARGDADPDPDDEARILRELLAWFDDQAEAERIPALIGRLGVGPMPGPSAVGQEAIERQIGWLRVTLGRWLETEPAAGAAAAASKQVEIFGARQLGQLLRINLREEMPQLQPLIQVWREGNVDLIESGIMAGAEDVHLRPSLLTDVSRMVEEAHTSGLRVEGLRDQFVARFGVSDSRAELIARDQVLKLNGQLNGARQQAVGIEEYRWSTSRDERVRETHAELDGTIHRWDDPPEVAPGRNEHPGGDYQCRCGAIPVPPRWLAETAQP